ALKEAMLTGKVSPENTVEASKPARSLYESSEERIKISKETQKAEEAEIYASAGDVKVQTGTYNPTGKTAEPAVYGSAAGKDGEQRKAAMGTVTAGAAKIADNQGIYAKAAQNPKKADTRAVKSNDYQYVAGYYYIQAGSFTNYELAHKQMVRLKEYGSSHIVPITVSGKKYYRVSVGPYSRVEEAKVAQAKLKYYGIKDTKIEQK
ncbi:MAG: SPOR domain-containing protein, partial [Alphaproteobacteria bacterium]|nr:SPOR domain-containing protein [Alphaproteobacteria bacterium]